MVTKQAPPPAEHPEPSPPLELQPQPAETHRHRMVHWAAVSAGVTVAPHDLPFLWVVMRANRRLRSVPVKPCSYPIKPHEPQIGCRRPNSAGR